MIKMFELVEGIRERIRNRPTKPVRNWIHNRILGVPPDFTKKEVAITKKLPILRILEIKEVWKKEENWDKQQYQSPAIDRHVTAEAG